MEEGPDIGVMVGLAEDVRGWHPNSGGLVRWSDEGRSLELRNVEQRGAW